MRPTPLPYMHFFTANVGAAYRKRVGQIMRALQLDAGGHALALGKIIDKVFRHALLVKHGASQMIAFADNFVDFFLRFIGQAKVFLSCNGRKHRVYGAEASCALLVSGKLAQMALQETAN